MWRWAGAAVGRPLDVRNATSPVGYRPLGSRSQNGSRRDTSEQGSPVVAGAVLVIGAALVLAPALFHVGAVFSDDPFRPPETVVTVVKTNADGEQTTQTTTKEADQSLVQRALATGGVLLFRVGIVAFAAFLAEAVVQRTLLGNFALKLVQLSFPNSRRRLKHRRRPLRRLSSNSLIKRIA